MKRPKIEVIGVLGSMFPTQESVIALEKYADWQAEQIAELKDKGKLDDMALSAYRDEQDDLQKEIAELKESQKEYISAGQKKVIDQDKQIAELKEENEKLNTYIDLLISEKQALK